MPDADDIINSFMVNKNKEALGEKIESESVVDDNYLSEGEKVKETFTGETPSNSDNGLLMARRILNTFIAIPILLGGIFSAFYIILSCGPSLLRFIKSVLFHIWL
ncbi:MAG: hypothetical protein IJ853_01545 [Rickettsiales bacterium]|nr:hypothetical protein [Rickettsiales bacterium]